MKVLVVRGSSESLAEFGLDGITDRTELIISTDSRDARDIYGQTYEVEFFDPDPADAAFAACLERIRSAWEEAHSDEAHLGHAAAGLWTFYWLSPDQETMLHLLQAGRSNALRAAASDYIDADFGEKRGPTINHLATEFIQLAA